MNKLFIAPHNDDEVLYGATIIMREKPLVVVVTDSYRQALRGEQITKEQRISETETAMDILDTSVMFLHIPDNDIGDDCLDALDGDYDIVYAPYPETDGNEDHNKIGELAFRKWPEKVVFYSTYTKNRPFPAGETIYPTDEERKLKNMALDCYQSQINMSNVYYFDQMKVRPECIIRTK